MTQPELSSEPKKEEPIQQFYAFEIITEQSRWDEVVDSLQKEDAIALDIESNGYFRYPDRICLIQIGLPDHVFLVDPLKVGNLKGLGRVLANPKVLKVFHSCENDLRALDRDFKFRVKNIFDTSIAAHFLGADKLGLANILKQFLNIELPKSKSLQRQDWTCRPLDQKSLSYAAGDVFHLLALKDELIQQLTRENRYAWVVEENQLLEKIKADAPTPPEDMLWAVKGSRKISDKERAILQQLALFREALCRDLDRAPFRVLNDAVLIELAKKPELDLKSVKGLNMVFKCRRQSALRQALKIGRRNQPIALRRSNGKRSLLKKGSDTKQFFNQLKAWREAKGKTYRLDPALVWPMTSFERLANHRSMQKAGNEVREWQKKEFSEEVENLLNELKSKVPEQEMA